MAKKKKAKRPPTSSSKKVTPSRQPSAVNRLIDDHPNLIPLAILLVLLLIFFSEVMFGGKTFMPPDKLNSASARPFIDESFDKGTYPKWNPYIFSGMPSFASLQSALYVDLIEDVTYGLPSKVLPIPPFTRVLINYFLLALLTYFVLMKKTGARTAALLASVALTFQPQIISFTAFGHNTKIATAVLIPIIYLLLDELLKKPRLHYFAFLAISVGLQLLRAHTQIAYYTWMMMGLVVLFWLVESIKKKQPVQDVLKSLGLVAGSLLLGVAMSSWLYLSVHEYAEYSIRGGGTGLDYIYATNWSFSPKELVTFLVPSFMGFGGDTYWGPMPFTDYPLYPGIVALFLAGMAVLLKRDRNVILLSLMTALALVISFGKHLPILYGPLFEFLPFFNKFRVPNMIHILIAFAIAALAGLGLYHLKAVTGKTVPKAIRIYVFVFTGVTALIALFLLLSKSAYFELIKGSNKPLAAASLEAAHQNAATDGLKALAFVGLSGLLVFQYVKGRLKWLTVGIAMIALVILDLWLVSSRLNNPRPQTDQGNFFAENHVVQFLKQDQELFRIYPVYDDKPVNWYMYHK
ncbi:hypothetical protein MJD09_23755, partial [bacterium]|nr:hypothetical protein [bacterium]